MVEPYQTIHGKLLVIKPDSFISSRMALLGGEVKCFENFMEFIAK